MPKSIKKLMRLGIDFWEDFGGFLEEKWRQVGTQIDEKSMPTSKRDFSKKPCFSSRKTMILKVQGSEVGSKNQSKNYPKMKSRWEGILASIFIRFWWIFGGKLGRKMEPRSIQKGIKRTLGPPRRHAIKRCLCNLTKFNKNPNIEKHS